MVTVMEKSSLGNFISLLRKEKGLTQKQLAELLNVSDKTVSHWECDETSPDISLLPELAKTLGVSVDELLKGEKKPSDSHFGEQKSEGVFDKAGKKINSLLDRIKSAEITDRYRYFRMLSLIGTVIACVVILSISLSSVLSAYFFSSRLMISIVMLIGSLWTIVLSLFFTLGARFIFSKALIPDKSNESDEKNYIYKANRVTFNNLVLLFGVFPLALTGIDILPVHLNIIVAIILIFAVRTIGIVILTKKGIFRRNEKEMLIIKYGCICLLLLGIGAGIHLFAVEVYYFSPDTVVFDNPEDFKAYMETPKEKPEDAYLVDSVYVTTCAPTIMLTPDGDYAYEEVYDSDGESVVQTPPNEEYIPTDTICDSDGKVVTFRVLNKDVYDYSYYEDEGTFHVVTYEAKIRQKDIRTLLDDGLGILMHIYYAAVIAGCFLSYRKKFKKIRKNY